MIETLEANGYKLQVSREHRFGTDAVKLAEFAAATMTKNKIICDLCTGCGIVPFLLLKAGPAKIFALDINEQAVELLRESVRINSLDEVIIPVLEDLKSVKSIAAGSIDVVTVNPPYYKADDGYKREGEAQARHELLCTIDDVAAAASRLLKYGGRLKMCHIPERLTDVICALRKNSLEPKTIDFVTSVNSNGKPWLMLIDAKKGGRPNVNIKINTGG